MEVNEELIKKIAGLSKLNLNQEEISKFTKDFKDILEAFKVLDEVDVKGVKSSYRPIEQKNVLREDKVENCLEQKEALKFTKNKEKGFFVGPGTIEWYKIT